MYPKLERFCLLLAKAIDDIANDLKIPHQINFTGSMFQIFFTNKPVVDYKSCKKIRSAKIPKNV